jgi:hypothetical protein
VLSPGITTPFIANVSPEVVLQKKKSPASKVGGSEDLHEIYTTFGRIYQLKPPLNIKYILFLRTNCRKNRF